MFFTAVVLLVALAACLEAQTVRGVLREAGTSTPIAGGV